MEALSTVSQVEGGEEQMGQVSIEDARAWTEIEQEDMDLLTLALTLEGILKKRGPVQ